MIDWVTAKITCTHNPEVLSSGRSIRTKIVDGVEHLEYEICNRLVVEGRMMQKSLFDLTRITRLKYQVILLSFYKVIIFSVLMI